jgi:glycosyltransferase involved in cell wall biosynthesis
METVLNKAQKPRALFIGSTRYESPLDETHSKKWNLLSSISKNTILSFFQSGEALETKMSESKFILLKNQSNRWNRYCSHFLNALWNTLKMGISGNVDIVVVQDPIQAVAPSIAIIMLRLIDISIKFIVEIHGDFYQAFEMYYPESKSKKWYGKIVRCLSIWTLKKADALRAVSFATYSFIPNGVKKPYYIFPSFTDIDKFLEPDLSLTDQWKRQIGNRYILFAGMLINLKGGDILIQAFARVKDRIPNGIKIVFAGDGRAKKDWEKLECRLGLNDGSLIFVGKQPQRQLAALMAGAECLVLPSITEGLGCVILEAMATGTPAIGSRVGGIPELIDDGINGYLVRPERVDELAIAIEKIMKNKKQRLYMGKAARKKAANTFSMELYKKGYQDMFKKVLNQ